MLINTINVFCRPKQQQKGYLFSHSPLIKKMKSLKTTLMNWRSKSQENLKVPDTFLNINYLLL